MDLKLWLQELYQPVCMIVASPAAEALCQSKNGLSLVDILRPHSHVSQLNVPIRVGEVVSKVKELKLAFHAASMMFQPAPEAMEEHLQAVLQSSAQKHAKLEPTPDLIAMMQSDKPAPIHELTPWFDEYRNEFMRMLSFGEHETCDHPVATIYVIPADVSHPTSHFDKLQEQFVPPPLMANELMLPAKDSDMAKHYVLLHDVASGADPKRASDNLAAMRKAYGEQHCSLLPINSGTGERGTTGAPPDFFRRFQRGCVVSGGGAGEPSSRPPPPPQGMGAHLTVQDLDSIARFIRGFTVQSLLPKLEERLLRLNSTITATRKGLRNRFTRFWKGNTEDTTTDKPYPWHSVEAQMRQMGDLAFLLQEYEFAAATYRLAAQDYQTQSNNKWYAGVEEMIGLCCILDPTESNDPLKYFTRAYEAYTKVPGKLSRMLATRCSLLMAAFQQRIGRHLSTSHVLMRAHFDEENARAALLLEQAAYALLYLRPPSTRKFAFQMVLSGLRYHSCGQKRLAIHAYRQVMGVYHGKQWRAIEEHLNDVLGKQSKECGDSEKAVSHFMNLLGGCSARPASVQTHYLTQFLDAVKKGNAQGLLGNGSRICDGLPLPLIAHRDVRVQFQDQCCTSGGDAAAQVPASTWAAMEQCCSVDAGGGAGNWLEGGKQERDGEEFNTCVAGEEVCVHVEFRNPLSIKLKLSSVRVICEFEPLPSSFDDSLAPATTSSTDASHASQTTLHSHRQPSKQPQESPAADAAGLVPDLHVGAASAHSTATATPVAFQGLGPLQPTLSTASSCDSDDEQHRPASSSAPPGSRVSGVSAHGTSAVVAGQGRVAQHHVQIMDDKFTLHPGESLVEPLRVVPLVAGWLRVLGVSWVLNDGVEGRVLFEPKGKLRKKPKGPRPAQLKHFSPPHRLLFSVIPAMPRLEVSSCGLPATMYSGELARMTVTLRNTGSLPLRNLQLVISHPQVACASNSDGLSSSIAECLSAASSECISSSPLPGPAAAAAAALGGSSSLSLYRVWPGVELQPGQSLDWPLWVHPKGAGQLRFNCVWYFEPAAPAPMRYRTLRVASELQVVRLLTVAATATPSQQDLTKTMLRLDVESSRESPATLLSQLTIMTPGHSPALGWNLETVNDESPAGLPGKPQQTEQQGQHESSKGGSKTRPRGQVTLHPRETLQPGDQSSIFVQLSPPVPIDNSTTGDDSSSSNSIAVKARRPSDKVDAAMPENGTGADRGSAGTLDFFQGGILSHFYGMGASGRPSGTKLSTSDLSALSIHAASKRSLGMAPTCPLLSVAPVSYPIGGPPPPPIDPPLALVLAWHIPGGAVGPSGDRLGVCRAKDALTRVDLSAALLNTATSAPIRTLLSGAAVTRHDFRQATLCLLPLQLHFRNNCAAPAKLMVEVGQNWQSESHDHSWLASIHPPAPANSNLHPLSSAASFSSLHPTHTHTASHPHPPPTHSLSTSSLSYQSLPTPSLISSTSFSSSSPLVPPPYSAVANPTHAQPQPQYTRTSSQSQSQTQGQGQFARTSLQARTSLDQPTPATPPGGTHPSHAHPQPPTAAAAQPSAISQGITYQAGLPPSPEYVWCGPTTVCLELLQPGESVAVALQVAVFRPGAYVVDDVRVRYCFAAAQDRTATAEK
ncbi:MAG: hypothetical protein WDW38_010029, partial [Sanguina aurantia]